jgi:hypothetical protein
MPLYGANVTLVDGLITDAGRLAAERGKPLGWYDVSTLKEPYRVEGKKTMAYELAEQMDWTWPDWIVYPTGGGTGMVGMWKAFEEIERIGWVRAGKRPRMVSVQAENCAPIVRAFEQGTESAEPWENGATLADGLRVPRAIGDFLILRAVRESGGTALAVPIASMVDGMLAIGKHAGVSAAPEGGAALVAIERLVADGSIKPHESVVLFKHRRRAEVSGCPEAAVARRRRRASPTLARSVCERGGKGFSLASASRVVAGGLMRILLARRQQLLERRRQVPAPTRCTRPESPGQPCPPMPSLATMRSSVATPACVFRRILPTTAALVRSPVPVGSGSTTWKVLENWLLTKA